MRSIQGTKGPLSLLQVCNGALIFLGGTRVIGTSVLFGHYHLYLLVFASKCFVFAPLLIGSTGLFSMIHGLLGIACYFPRRHFVAYMVALGLISSAEIVSSGLFYYLKKGASEDFFSSVNAARELESYELSEAVANRWDGLHRRYNCCGAHTTGNGNTDWNRVRIGSVPDSCCIQEYSGCGGDVLAVANDQKIPIGSLIHVEGCLTVLQRVLHLEILPILSALTFLTLLSALIQLFLVFFTICLIRHLRNRGEDGDDIISMSEFTEESMQYAPYLKPGGGAEEGPSPQKDSGSRRSFFRGSCCPCLWRRRELRGLDEEENNEGSYPRRIKLKELTDWEAIEREEMLMSVLDSVLMSRRSSDGLRRSNKSIFPIRMLPIESHPSRFEYQMDPGAHETYFDFLYEDKYKGHPPINRVVVKEGAMPRPSRISLNLKEDINSISKRVNFSTEHLPQVSSSYKKRFLSDLTLPKYKAAPEDDGDDVPPFPGQKALRRKRLSLPSNIHLKKSRSDIASEYLSMDYEESVVQPGLSSSKVKGKARKLSETRKSEQEIRGTRGQMQWAIPSKELLWTKSHDDIIEEITVEEKEDFSKGLSSEKASPEEERLSVQNEKAQSTEYVSPEQIRLEKREKRSQSLPRQSNDKKNALPSRKISFSISPYEESKPVQRLYQRKQSLESDPSASPLNHDKMYSLVFDDNSPSIRRRRSHSIHEDLSSPSSFLRKQSLPHIDSRPTTSKAFQRWASIDNQIISTLPKMKKDTKKSSTLTRTSKSMDSIRRVPLSNKQEPKETPIEISTANKKPLSAQSLTTCSKESSDIPRRKVDIFLGGSFRSRSNQRSGTLMRRGQVARGAQGTLAPIKSPRKAALKTSEL